MSTQFSKEMNLNKKINLELSSPHTVSQLQWISISFWRRIFCQKDPWLALGLCAYLYFSTRRIKAWNDGFLHKYCNTPPWDPAACDPRPKASVAKLVLPWLRFLRKPLEVVRQGCEKVHGPEPCKIRLAKLQTEVLFLSWGWMLIQASRGKSLTRKGIKYLGEWN